MADSDQLNKETLKSFSKHQSQDGMDLDDLLPQVGEFGRYQKLLLWLVCLPACIPCGFCAFNQLFMADVPKHWCLIPDLIASNTSFEERQYLGIPEEGENKTYSSCKMYAVNWTELLQGDYMENITPNSSWPTQTCQYGWEYSRDEVKSSIVIDFDLICEHAIYPTIGLVALNAGGPIGVYSFGVINDRYGRRISFFLCLTVVIFGNLLTSFAKSFWVWTGCRFIVGLTTPAVYQIPFIISLELVGPNYRSFVTVMTCLFYTFGLILLAAVTYFVRDWVNLCRVTSLPFLLYYIYWWFLPESPRWLLAKGRIEEASKILETLARVNSKELPDTFRQKLKQKMSLQRTFSEEQRLKKGPGVLSLCRTPNMRLKTALITLNWFANEMVYVGLSYYGPSLGNNRYLSFVLSSLVEIPSYLTCWVVMDRWGRRWPLSICMILSGISCIVTVLLPPDSVTLLLLLFLFAKFTISASFLIIYPFAGELYPTQIRGIGIGASAYIGGLGLIIIPFITYLGTENLVLPLVIMGVVSVIGGISGLRLPETLHHRLPQTVEEGEEFGKDWSWSDCVRCIPKKPNAIDASSYEDLDRLDIEMNAQNSLIERRGSILNKTKLVPPKLVRQSSILETPLDSSGSMKMTYWF